MKRIALALPLLLLAACAGEDAVSRYQPMGFVTDAERISAEADWNAAQLVELQVVNHAFVPNEFTIRRNKPVRLVLKNTSKGDHTFVSKSFFKGIAVRQLVGPGVTYTAPWVEKVVVPAGETKELWFVPTRYGAYPFECTVTGHSLLGMTGIVNVME
jgi:uncharacterized cupredoxin-like copper-binding protein